VIVGNCCCNDDRHMRAEFKPCFSKTTISTIKCIHKKQGQDFATLAEANAAQATVCVPKGAHLMQVAMDKFPNANCVTCMPGDDCIEHLKDEKCVLFADDELLLHCAALQDLELQVTHELFNTQCLVWSLGKDLDRTVSKLFKKWMRAAVANATMDRLHFEHFQRERCTVGTAGLNCEKPCDPAHGTADAEGNCVCQSAKWTGDDCKAEVQEELNLLFTPLAHGACALVGINHMLVPFCGWWLFCHREQASVQVAQPSILMTILVGCVTSTSAIFLLTQEDTGDGAVACMACPWLCSVGFSITFGSLFARIRRICLLLKSGARMQQVDVSTRETVLIVLTVFFIDVTALSIWTIVDPMEWQRVTTSSDGFGRPLESRGFCTSDSWMVWVGIIAAFHFPLTGTACCMSYEARHVPESLQNGRHASIAMFSNLQIVIVGLPVLFIASRDPQASFFVRSLAIWINDFAVLTLVVGNLIWKHCLERRKAPMLRGSSKLRSQAAIQKDIKKHAQQAARRKSAFNLMENDIHDMEWGSH